MTVDDNNNNDNNNAPSSAAAANVATRPPVDDEKVAAEKFDAGRVITRGFSIFARRFVPLTALAFVVFLPWIVANADATSVDEGERLHHMMTYVAMFLS